MRRAALLLGIGVLLGGTLAVSAASGPGKLKVETLGMVLEVEKDGRKVAIPPGREVPVGSGTLEVKGIQLHAKGVDKKNRPAIWRLDGTKPFGELAKIEVPGGETKAIEGGAPITVKTPATITKKGGATTVTVGLAFIGKSGESYRTIVYMGRRRVPAPRIQFLDEQGKPLHTANFEYG